MQRFCLKQQKAAALEAMSLICAGNYRSVLKAVANQKDTIETIKTLFDQFIGFTGKKSNIVEPTFIGISSYNEKMGDWIIQRICSMSDVVSKAPLLGKLICCDPRKVAERLNILLDMIVDALRGIKSDK